MVATDHLFILIKSLTKSEKVYFKKFASLQKSGEETNSIRLFDAIDAQRIYDEKKLKDRFKGESFTSRLPFEKIYLTKLIYKSLGNYHSSRTVGVGLGLKDTLKYAEILYDKSLYTQSLKLLEKARKLAITYDRFPDLLEILKWEKLITHKLEETGKRKMIIRMELETMMRYKNFLEYHDLSDRMLEIIHKIGVARSNRDIAGSKKLISHPLLKKESRALSYSSTVLFFIVRGLYYYWTEDLVNSKLSYEKLINYMESKPELLKDPTNMRRYLAGMNNFLQILSLMGEYEYALDQLKKIKTYLAGKSSLVTATIFTHIWQVYYQYSLSVYLDMGMFEESLKFIPIIEEGKRIYKGKISEVQQATFTFNIAIAFLGSGKYRQSVRWLNRLLSEEATLRPDLTGWSKILLLIVHFEMKTDDILPYLLRSTYRFLLKRNRLYKSETAILNFIRNQVPKINNLKEQTAAFKKLKDEIEKIIRDPYEKKILSYFDLLSWLESKTENRSFAAIVKEKAKRK